MTELGRILIFVGLALLVVGGIVLLLGKAPGLPFGKLPGDFTWQRGNVKVYFPLATMVVVSIILTIVINLIIRIFK